MLSSKQLRGINFVSLLVLSGEVTVKYDGGEVKAQKGGSILIPQDLKVLLSGIAEVIYTEQKYE